MAMLLLLRTTSSVTTIAVTCHSPLSSSTLSQSTLPSSPESNLLGVMGVSDWDFLRPPSSPPEEDESKRPSLDDFDGEIAIFQVRIISDWRLVPNLI